MIADGTRERKEEKIKGANECDWMEWILTFKRIRNPLDKFFL